MSDSDGCHSCRPMTQETTLNDLDDPGPRLNEFAADEVNNPRPL